MADPTVTLIASNTSATATTTVSFTAQPAGTLLVLTALCDDYRTTSGANRPEGNGWTVVPVQTQQNVGHYMWWKIATGSETSVAYTIGSAAKSAHQVLAATNVASTGTYDTGAANFKNSFQADWTTASITPGAGRKLVVAAIGGSTNGTPVTGLGSWTNSYVSTGTEAFGQTGPQMNVGTATLALDGGTATSTGATWTGSGPGNISSIIASFTVATGGGGTDVTATPADGVGVTDSATEVQAYVRTQGDPVGVTDGVTAQRTGSSAATPADPVGITDGLTVAWGRAATINDGVGVTDPGQSLDMGATVTDNVAVTDAAAEVQAYAATLGDTVGVTDSATASRSGAGAANPNDAAGITDAIAQASDFTRAAADPVGVSDALTVAWSRVSTVDDFLALTDAASSGTTSDGAANVNDPAGVTDTVAWSTTRDRPLTDPVGVSDGVVAVLDRVTTTAPADTVGVTDTVIAQRAGALDGTAVRTPRLTLTVSDSSLTLTTPPSRLELD